VYRKWAVAMCVVNKLHVELLGPGCDCFLKYLLFKNILK
jgi:hypothetical protein